MAIGYWEWFAMFATDEFTQNLKKNQGVLKTTKSCKNKKCQLFSNQAIFGDFSAISPKKMKQKKNEKNEEMKKMKK